MSGPTDPFSMARRRPDATSGTSDQKRASTGGVPDSDAVTETHVATPPTCLQSEALLQGRNSVEIAHLGAIYRLQTTRQGKLILTK